MELKEETRIARIRANLKNALRDLDKLQARGFR